MKLAILFDNFGPYHIARLRAAAQRFNLLGVEVAHRSTEYAWKSPWTPAEEFKQVTLFSRDTIFENAAPKFSSLLNRELSSFGPDAVAIPGWSGWAAFAALYWCLRNATPAIVMSESSAQDKTRNGLKERIKCRYLSYCSAALVGGRKHAEYLRILGLPSDCIFLGYDAVDNTHFRLKAEKIRDQKRKGRPKAGLPEHFFLASARFVEKKNLPRLLEAYARYRVLAKSEAWDLVLLGDGPLRTQLSSRLSALGLNACVHLPGFKQYEELPDYYGSALAFVHASTTEQWGLVVNEAMATGLPVLISNRCGCTPELVQEGVNGFTFDPWDVELIAQLMFQLSTLEIETLAKMGEASCRISTDWGLQRFVSGLTAATERALQIGPKRASRLDHFLLRALMCR
jgi:glycosyltransferase involved in cell wall biosynthesis